MEEKKKIVSKQKFINLAQFLEEKQYKIQSNNRETNPN
jgi:hypothetical protein